MKNPILLALPLLGLLAACAPSAPQTSQKPTVVVTYALLGNLVQDLVGDAYTVVVSMPDGMDPHEWEPSARDREALQKAVLIVQNGEGLEAGMDESIDQAAEAGIPVFTASEHMPLLDSHEEEGHDEAEHEGEDHEGEEEEHHHGAHDPHLWMDPMGMKSVILALAKELKSRFGTDLDGQAADLAARLDTLDAEIRTLVDTLPPAQRLLVTGHESLGYFAHAYGFELVGAIVPSLSSRAEVSASDMAALKAVIQDRKVTVIFTELGTPPKVAQALGTEVGLRVVEITTHSLGAGGTYFTYLKDLATGIVNGLKG